MCLNRKIMIIPIYFHFYLLLCHQATRLNSTLYYVYTCFLCFLSLALLQKGVQGACTSQWHCSTHKEKPTRRNPIQALDSPHFKRSETVDKNSCFFRPGFRCVSHCLHGHGFGSVHLKQSLHTSLSVSKKVIIKLEQVSL